MIKSKCNLCPRNCNKDRINEKGFCGASENIVISLWQLHKWEEPCIVGKNGSGTIFFSGCNLKCCYCQNYEISTYITGKEYTTQQIVELFKEIEDSGATNINLVTPTHYIKQLCEAFKVYKPKIPIVYNTSGYEKIDALKLIDEYIDIYLVDYKYFDNSLAFRLSKAVDYRNVAVDAIKYMCDSKVDYFDDNGVMKKGVIIRHLILPNNVYNTIKVLEDIKLKFPNRLVSLMAQYVPMYKAKEMKDINRRINKREYNRAVDHYIKLGLNGFIQEMSSASECYIPKFNGK